MTMRKILILNDNPDAAAAEPIAAGADPAVDGSNAGAAAPQEATPAEPTEAPSEPAPAETVPEETPPSEETPPAEPPGDEAPPAEETPPAGDETPPNEEQPGDETPPAIPEEVQQTLQDFNDINAWISNRPEYVVDYYKEVSKRRRLRPEEMTAFDDAQEQVAQKAPAGAAAAASSVEALPSDADVEKECEELDRQGKSFAAAKKWQEHKDNKRQIEQRRAQQEQERRDRAARERGVQEASLTRVKTQFAEAHKRYPGLVKPSKHNPIGFVIADEPLREEMLKISRGVGAASVETVDLLETALVRLGRHQAVRPGTVPARKPAAGAPAPAKKAPAAKPVAPRPAGAAPAAAPGMRRIPIVVENGRK